MKINACKFFKWIEIHREFSPKGSMPMEGGGMTTISNFIRHPPSFGSHQSFSHHLSFHQVPNAEIQGKIDWVRVPEAKTAEKVSAMSEFSTLTSRLPSQLTNYWPTTPPVQ